MAFHQTQFQDFHISLRRSLTFSSCNLDDLRPVFTQGRAELAPICKLHELFLQPNSGLQAPVKTDWREPTCFILDIAWAQVNGLNEREQRTEERERDSPKVLNFLIKCSQPLFCGRPLIPLKAECFILMNLWRKTPSFHHFCANNNQPGQGRSGRRVQREPAHAIQWVKNTLTCSSSPDRKCSECEEKVRSEFL